ncbi:hypothetical protein GL272_19610 [Aeromonas veronii]|uniref:hypothetical protein n=1 Tax=Aeromonas TaxID=642 RepID=UPI000640AE18|nr:MULTISPECIES: hypothetical protein [Aeromonas]AKJ36927.1 hypothetical protein U876_24140 [Aeromonas hydrophila NJ-35]MBW3762708.1 hypothetical protein [Aeromonas jandaei]MBW3779083.1 hypothetical protein [Aeromonas veronii]HDK8695711.1 hypothetical protein [Aeromonas hydrophila]
MTIEELQDSYDEAVNSFKLISELNNKQLSASEDDYINLNRAYFRICTNFYESFLHLIGNGKPFPAIVILRSFLEIYTKAIYLDIIEKPKGTDVKPLISGEKDFPSFFKMTSALDKFGEEGKNGLEGMFKQFTKQDLAQYEKFSLFTHGRGEFVEAFMNMDNAQLCIEGVSDLIVTAKGMYETLSLHYFGLQKLTSELQRLAHELQKSTMYKNS